MTPASENLPPTGLILSSPTTGLAKEETFKDAVNSGADLTAYGAGTTENTEPGRHKWVSGISPKKAFHLM